MRERILWSLFLYICWVPNTHGFLAELFDSFEDIPLRFVSGTCYVLLRRNYDPGELEMFIKVDRPSVDLYSWSFFSYDRQYEGQSYKILNLKTMKIGLEKVKFTISYFGSAHSSPKAWCKTIPSDPGTTLGTTDYTTTPTTTSSITSPSVASTTTTRAQSTSTQPDSTSTTTQVSVSTSTTVIPDSSSATRTPFFPPTTTPKPDITTTTTARTDITSTTQTPTVPTPTIPGSTPGTSTTLDPGPDRPPPS